MGIEHVTWALRKVRGIDTAAKMVLISLSNFADAAGLCWPSVGTIVDDTGLSEATVKRRLADLVKAGAMTRRERVAEGKRQKSNIYALNTNWMGAPELEPGLSGKMVHGVLVDEIGADRVEDDVSDGVHGEPHHGAQGEPDGAQGEPHRGLRVSPPLSLNRQSDPSGKEEEEARALEIEFQKLVVAFDPGPTESLQRGRLALGALSADEVALAVKHATDFVKALASEKRKRPSIATYLAERRWEAVVRQAAKTPAQKTGGKVFVCRDSEPWHAWAKHLGKEPRSLPTLYSQYYGATGWYFGSTLYPPKQAGERKGDAA